MWYWMFSDELSRTVIIIGIFISKLFTGTGSTYQLLISTNRLLDELELTVSKAEVTTIALFIIL